MATQILDHTPSMPTTFTTPEDELTAVKVPDYNGLRLCMGDSEYHPTLGDIVNYERNSCANGCVMCGLVGKTIPVQNKQVCKECDSSFWFLKEYNVVVKFCKGCKNFASLGSFTDKPGASKCGKCRQRGKNSYLAKKGMMPMSGSASSSFEDDDTECGDSSTYLQPEEHEAARLKFTSSYTPAPTGSRTVAPMSQSGTTAVTGCTALSVTIKCPSTTGHTKRSREDSIDADLSRFDGSTDCSTMSSSSETECYPAYISPPTSDTDGSIFEFPDSPRCQAGAMPRVHSSSLNLLCTSSGPLPTRPPTCPNKKPKTFGESSHKAKVQIHSSAGGLVVGRGEGAPRGNSSSSSPSNLQDRWQWDPMSNPLNYLVLATAMHAPPLPPAEAAFSAPSISIPVPAPALAPVVVRTPVDADADADADAPAPATSTSTVEAFSSASRRISTAVAEMPQVVATTSAPLAPTVQSPVSGREGRLVAVCTAGLLALVELVRSDDKENGAANAPAASLLPLPQAALSELELWVKRWASAVDGMKTEE